MSLDIPSLDDRLAKSRQIYQNAFQAAQDGLVANNSDSGPGLERNTKNIDPQSAFLVGYRFNDPLTSPVDTLSQRVQSVLGGQSLTYDSRNLHATVSDYKLAPGVLLPDGDADFTSIVTELRSAVEQAVSECTKTGLSITFREPVTNGQTVVVPGEPSAELDALSVRIIEEAQARGIGLKLPWGYHLTVNRFAASFPRSTPQVDELLKLLQSQPAVGKHHAASVFVGYFNTSPDPKQGFQLEIVNSWGL